MCEKNWKSRSSSKKKSVAEREGKKEESIPTWPRPSRHYLWRVRGNCNLSPPSIDDVVPDQS